MIKKLCFLLLIPLLSNAQSLSVSIENSSAGNGYSTFQLGDNNVKFSGNSISFVGAGANFTDYLVYGLSPDFSIIGVLKNTPNGAKAYLLNTKGDTLASYNTISLSYNDPSLAIYPANSGAVLIRNNIANFTLYSPDGQIITGASVGSQSKQGEVMSEAAMDNKANSILLYTPKIKNNGGFGSQVQILKENNTTENIYYSSDSELKYGGVSEYGQFISLITAEGGTDHQVIIQDWFGNELNKISSDEDLAAVRFSDEGDYLLVYSSRRALVYSTMEGERDGSTSFRSPLIIARYFPEDNTIIGVTGVAVDNTDIVKEIEFHVINLEQREIARKELDGALGSSPNIPIKLQREGPGRYKLLGTNKVINLKIN